VLMGNELVKEHLLRIGSYHISQGDSVVYIVAPLYADAGRRPEFSSADVSP
jgi:hypothetical protein